MRDRNPSERAIIFAGILGSLSLSEINQMLLAVAPAANPLIESSYLMMRKSYFAKMVDGIGREASGEMNAFGRMLYHPKPIGDH